MLSCGPMNNHTYYVTRSLTGGGFELRQTRFIGNESHPHDVCAVASTVPQMRETVAVLKGSIDWSRVTTEAKPPTRTAKAIPDCPVCSGETEQNGLGGYACHFCGFSGPIAP